MISPLTSSAQVDLFAAPKRGIRAAIDQANAAGEKIADGDLDPDNMIDLLEAQILVKANAATLRTSDDILGSLINTKA